MGGADLERGIGYVLRATTKKGRQLFLGKKCTPEKILATPITCITFLLMRMLLIAQQ